MWKFNFSSAELGKRRSDQLDGVGADTLLRVLLPLIEKRLDGLLMELVEAKPDLNTLLNLKAQIGEVMRIKRELERVKQVGQEASEAIQEIFTS